MILGNFGIFINYWYNRYASSTSQLYIQKKNFSVCHMIFCYHHYKSIQFSPTQNNVNFYLTTFSNLIKIMSEDHKIWANDTIESVKVVSQDAESNSEDVLAPDVAELPKIVREIVPLEYDPTIPVMRFRLFLLATIFIIPGSFISTLNSFRTTTAAYSIFFV